MVFSPNPKKETETVAGRLKKMEKKRFYEKASEIDKKPSHIVRELIMGFVNDNLTQVSEELNGRHRSV